MRTQRDKNILMTREEYTDVINQNLAWMTDSQIDEMGGFMTYEQYVESKQKYIS
tara:strand:- start:25 stop:186 length:162 start_codon:yes stop_codon:yes gene_type:complete